MPLLRSASRALQVEINKTRAKQRVLALDIIFLSRQLADIAEEDSGRGTSEEDQWQYEERRAVAKRAEEHDQRLADISRAARDFSLQTPKSPKRRAKTAQPVKARRHSSSVRSDGVVLFSAYI